MRNLLLFIALISYPYLSIAQENQELQFDYQVLYKMRWQPDTANQEQTREETTELLINDDISLFQTVLLGKIDSINYLRYTRHPSAPNHNEYYTHFNTQVLKDGDDTWTTDIIAPDRQNSGEIFRKYKESRSELDWEIQGDTARIGEFICQLATLDFGNRKWLAWFAADIPIPDGPYKFCGLPGLIVRIHDEKRLWHFELEHIQRNPKTAWLNFSRQHRPILTTKSQFFADKRHYQNNYLEIQEANGIDYISAENRMIIKKNVEWNFRANSNWIEPYP